MRPTTPVRSKRNVRDAPYGLRVNLRSEGTTNPPVLVEEAHFPVRPCCPLRVAGPWVYGPFAQMLSGEDRRCGARVVRSRILPTRDSASSAERPYPSSCGQCGTELPRGVKFCNRCGKP